MDTEGRQPYIDKSPFSPRLPSHPGCPITLSVSVLYSKSLFLPKSQVQRIRARTSLVRVKACLRKDSVPGQGELCRTCSVDSACSEIASPLRMMPLLRLSIMTADCATGFIAFSCLHIPLFIHLFSFCELYRTRPTCPLGILSFMILCNWNLIKNVLK